MQSCGQFRGRKPATEPYVSRVHLSKCQAKRLTHKDYNCKNLSVRFLVALTNHSKYSGQGAHSLANIVLFTDPMPITYVYVILMWSDALP